MRSLLLRGAQILRPGGLWSPLDALAASLYAAYGLRRLVSTWTGPLVTVRRDSDNATLDVGATTTGRLDTAALIAFTGGASAFVTRWWDQTGGGRHAIQSTAVRQPLLVTAGVIETMTGSIPAIKFNGTAHNMIVQNSASAARAVGTFTAALLSSGNASDADQCLLDIAFTPGGGARFRVIRLAGSTFSIDGRRLDADAYKRVASGVTDLIGAISLICRIIYSNALADITVNGVTTASGFQTAGLTSDTDNRDIFIGSTSSYLNFYSGRMNSVVLAQPALDIAATDRALSEILT